MSTFDTSANIELLKKAQEGDTQAREELITRNMGLVRKVSARYQPLGMALIDKDDVMQEGMIGLMYAIQNFNFDKGIKFSTYACCYIEWFIKKLFSNNQRALSISRNDYSKMQRMLVLKEKYYNKTNKVAPTSYLAKWLKITEQKVKDLERFNSMGCSYFSQTTDSSADDSELLLGDTIADDYDLEGFATESIQKDELKKFLGWYLEPDEKKVIFAYFWEKKSLRSIALSMNITLRMAKLILKRTVRKLQKNEYMIEIAK